MYYCLKNIYTNMYTTPFRPSDLYHKICFCLVWTTCCTDIAVMLNLGLLLYFCYSFL